jgi:hypothetical protein
MKTDTQLPVQIPRTKFQWVVLKMKHVERYDIHMMCPVYELSLNTTNKPVTTI